MTNSQILVTKRDNTKEEIDLDKIHRVIEIAKGDDLTTVSVSEVALKSHIQFYNGMKTSDIQSVIIKTAADLTSEEFPQYSRLAARLAIFEIRKRAFGQTTPPALLDHILKLTNMKKYDPEIMANYTEEEIQMLGDYIDHDRDMNFSYAAVNQLMQKYLVQDRVTKEIYESPQMLYMLVSMVFFMKYDKQVRLDYVKRFYDATSLFKISLPTPIMAGLRTPTRQFSSCVLIETGDSLNSINRAAASIVKYVSQKAGIGINAGRIRGIGSPIRGGDAYHTGCIPFFKHFQTAVKSCSQGGVRGGAATLFYPMWHIEVENLLVLKNNRGVEENRVRHLDYGVQINGFMYHRLIKGESISLFSPHEVPGLYDAFFANQKRFEQLYHRYENDPSIRKKTVKAIDLFGMMMSERASTGRIYIQNVDHCNTHSPFNPEVAPILQSNLCLEIALPTVPVDDEDHSKGEIALCTLAAFNLGMIDDLDDLYPLADLIVRALDELLDYQNYPVEESWRSTNKYRPLGTGVTDFAHYLAKRGLKYSDGSANVATHQLFETIQHALLTASADLAEEKGACEGYANTRYSKGIMPIDTYKEALDDIVGKIDLIRNWTPLRHRAKTTGLRNATLTALMPSETSSQITNSTNGIEPPIGLISVKSSKDGVVKQVVPDYETLKDAYETRWEMKDNTGYLNLVAIMQKFVDQSISANTNYDPHNYPKGMVPMKVLLADLLKAYKAGVKTLYYHNTRDHSGKELDLADQGDCDSGGCKI